MPSKIMAADSDCEQVPVIDLSLLKYGLDHHDSEITYTKVRKACEEWGCFQVVNHEIEEEIIHQMDSAVRDTFALSKETKQECNSVVGWNVGYFTDMPSLPFYESIRVPGAPDPAAIQKFSDHLWPQGNPKICKIIEDYTSRVEELTINIIKIILRSFGVAHYYSTCQFEGILRMCFCSSPAREKGGCHSHTDQSCVTVMYQDNTGGLQVESKAGKWADVKPAPNSFFVFTGDSFKAWSNGRVHSVRHRVVCENSSRVSVPYFYFFSDQTLIDAPPELVDDEHPRLYKPFAYGDYKDYCQPKKRATSMRVQNFLTAFEETFLDEFAGISIS
ncbi:hypothetical protein KI387_030540 [Taxus chinensis]|uniref:Fe2OG dioxygenase domain-containing protein n=1 Tax=Taxus chinensis TaxID=29808 RepID=A0AA38CHH6_TAXCH|nr:hypothetical protein KI387_030540 [Taxus chinensis]